VCLVKATARYPVYNIYEGYRVRRSHNVGYHEDFYFLRRPVPLFIRKIVVKSKGPDDAIIIFGTDRSGVFGGSI
jgi:hypothetical protein